MTKVSLYCNLARHAATEHRLCNKRQFEVWEYSKKVIYIISDQDYDSSDEKTEGREGVGHQ